MKKVLFALLAFCIILPACGGDDDGSVSSMDDASSSSESGSSSASASSSASEQVSAPSEGEQAIADALAAVLVSDPEFPFPDAAACLAETTIGEIGLSRIVELGITEDSFEGPLEEQSPEVQEAFINAVLDCIDSSALATLIVELSNDDPEDGPPLRMEDAECIAEELGREQWAIFLEGAFSGDELTDAEGAEFFTAILKECPQIFVNQIKDDLGLDQAQAECLTGALTDTLIDAFSSGALENDDAPPELFEELIVAFVGCGIELSQLE